MQKKNWGEIKGRYGNKYSSVTFKNSKHVTKIKQNMPMREREEYS